MQSQFNNRQCRTFWTGNDWLWLIMVRYDFLFCCNSTFNYWIIIWVLEIRFADGCRQSQHYMSIHRCSINFLWPLLITTGSDILISINLVGDISLINTFNYIFYYYFLSLGVFVSDSSNLSLLIRVPQYCLVQYAPNLRLLFVLRLFDKVRPEMSPESYFPSRTFESFVFSLTFLLSKMALPL